MIQNIIQELPVMLNLNLVSLRLGKTTFKLKCKQMMIIQKYFGIYLFLFKKHVVVNNIFILFIRAVKIATQTAKVVQDIKSARIVNNSQANFRGMINLQMDFVCYAQKDKLGDLIIYATAVQILAIVMQIIKYVFLAKITDKLNVERNTCGEPCQQNEGYYIDGQYCKKCNIICKTCKGPSENDCNDCIDAAKKYQDRSCKYNKDKPNNCIFPYINISNQCVCNQDSYYMSINI
ncbi:hypothetical protein ABPG72_016256 [Tetrahymena utriculariae]